MLADFLDRIVGLAKGAHRVDFHKDPALPRKVFIRHGDELLERDAPPEDRDHRIEGFDDLVALLRDPSIAPAPEVYVGEAEILAFLDHHSRVDSVTVPLPPSKRMQLLASLEASPKQFEPRQLVKLLRLELHGGHHDHMIQSLSRLNFTRTSTGHSHVDHGRESLGRAVEAAVQQAENVAPRFQVIAPLWTTHGFQKYQATVECGVDLLPEAQAVELRVLSDEITRARNQGRVALAADLTAALGEGARVFLGSP